jgi:hypothetical protein
MKGQLPFFTVSRHRMESFADTFIRGTIRRCGEIEP